MTEDTPQSAAADVTRSRSLRRMNGIPLKSCIEQGHGAARAMQQQQQQQQMKETRGDC